MVPLPEPSERRRRSPRVPESARATFLEAFAAGWSATHAAERTGIHKRRSYELRATDEKFAEAWREASEAGLHRLEDEAWRRAVEGYDELTYSGDGELIRRVRRYDSQLLQTLLKKKDPSYREGATQIAIGSLAGPDPDTVDALDKFTAEIARLAERQQAIGELSAGEGAAVVEGDWWPIGGEL